MKNLLCIRSFVVSDFLNIFLGRRLFRARLCNVNVVYFRFVYVKVVRARRRFDISFESTKNHILSGIPLIRLSGCANKCLYIHLIWFSPSRYCFFLLPNISLYHTDFTLHDRLHTFTIKAPNKNHLTDAILSRSFTQLKTTNKTQTKSFKKMTKYSEMLVISHIHTVTRTDQLYSFRIYTFRKKIVQISYNA